MYIYVEIPKDSSVRYKKKEKLPKKYRERYQSLSEEEKSKIKNRTWSRKINQSTKKSKTKAS